MSCKVSSNNNEHPIKILFKLTEKIKISNEEHNTEDSIGNQLGLFQDIDDIIQELNSNTILLPDFFSQLKISPLNDWNGITKRIFSS